MRVDATVRIITGQKVDVQGYRVEVDKREDTLVAIKKYMKPQTGTHVMLVSTTLIDEPDTGEDKEIEDGLRRLYSDVRRSID